MLNAEIAIYPENNNQGDDIVNRSIQAIQNMGLNCHVDHMNTQISGDESQVWEGLRKMYREASKQDTEFSMTITITNH